MSTHHHAPSTFHTHLMCQEQHCHALPRATCAYSISRTATSALGDVILPHQNTSRWLWPSHWPLTRLLTVDFDQSQKFSTGPILFSFSHRFWFFAPFLHLRSLNPTFWSFSSLCLNKTNEISYVLSSLCWMVLLAIMHGLKIWFSFSRVINYGDMWLVQFLSQYQNLSPKP